MKIQSVFLLATLALAACNDNDAFVVAADTGVVVGARSAGYDSGAHSVLSVDEPFSASNQLDPSASSDIGVVGGAGHFYRLMRFGTNQISRYAATDPSTPIYTYSTDSTDEAESNPYTIIEASENKAYVLRYGSGKLWIVNPSAANEAQFKIGEIDLSHYDADGVPEMAAAAYQDGKLYVGMQRLESFNASQNSYLAVIDTTTDSEVDTRSATSQSSLLGVDLNVRNVTAVTTVPGSSVILALAAGGYDENFAPKYDGGIVTVDTSNYQTTQIFDDAVDRNVAPGQLSSVTVDNAQRAFVTLNSDFDFALGYSPTSLFAFNPLTGEVDNSGNAIAGLADTDLGDVETDALGRVWVARTDSAAPGVTVLAVDNTVLADLIETVLIPTNIAFIQ